MLTALEVDPPKAGCQLPTQLLTITPASVCTESRRQLRVVSCRKRTGPHLRSSAGSVITSLWCS